MNNYDVGPEEVILAAVACGKSETYTSLPGKITKYDPATQTCSVKPQILVPIFDPITNEQGTSEELPELQNIPVGFFSGGGFSIVFDLQPGDTCTIEWQYLSTGQWRASGQLSEPQDIRRHNIGAAIVRPDARTMAKALLSPTLFKGYLAIGADGDPTGTIRVKAGEVICGGAAPLPLAMGPSTAASIAALQAEIVALQAAFIALTTTIFVPGGPGVLGLVDPSGAALTAVGTTSGTVVTAQSLVVTAQSALVPAKITKGQ